jgi:phosphopantetheinyl transferase (holo-ACP synthase)|tara:strand:- start:53505 stop:53690 length:186 start_codon:yes stop_codon:yes gene_type:complete
VKKCFLSSSAADKMGFNEIEVLPDDNGAPLVSQIPGYGYTDLKVSISHESEYAIAMALLVI